MYAVDFRSMRTAIHGLFVGKDRRRVEKFHDRLQDMCRDDVPWKEEDLEIAWQMLDKDFPDVKFVEEVDFRRFYYNKKGIWGCDLDGKWCRILNLVALDIWGM